MLGLAVAIAVFAELYARKLYHGYTLAIAGYLYRFPEQLRFDAAVFYGSLAGLILFGLFVSWTMLPIATDSSRFRKRFTLLARASSLLTLLVVIVPALIVYARMLHGPAIPPSPYEGQPNSYLRVEEIVDELTNLNPNALPLITYRTPTTASAAKRLEQLQSELVLLLETPGHVPFEVEKDTWSDVLAYARNARIVGRMLDAEVNAAEEAGRVGKASEYSLASVRLGSSISRGGMLHHWSIGVAIEDPG
ncbi:unnamed protein product, partial [marine sediment metagenome]